MRNKSILIAIVMVSSSLAGCTSDNSEEDLSARYQEGYDAGYGDAYDASYDGVAQHHYNEGWDDGWGIANSDSQAGIMEMRAEIMEMQVLASNLNQTIQTLLDEIDAGYDGAAQHYYNEGWDDGWEIANSDSQAEIMEMRALASSLNETIVSLQSADLSNADLSNANLTGAYLNGADLSGTIWYGTICPDGANSDDNGNTCENNLI